MLVHRRRLHIRTPVFRNPFRLYRLLTANPLKSSHPIALQIEVTSRCNFHCRYCIHHLMAEHGKQIGDMPLDRFVEILDRHKSTVQVVHIQGQGEHLLHPQFAEMVAECKREGLDTERVFALPSMIPYSKATRALCISNRDFYSRKGCGTCSKANFVYYRWAERRVSAGNDTRLTVTPP